MGKASTTCSRSRRASAPAQIPAPAATRPCRTRSPCAPDFVPAVRCGDAPHECAPGGAAVARQVDLTLELLGPGGTRPLIRQAEVIAELCPRQAGRVPPQQIADRIAEVGVSHSRLVKRNG